MPTLWFSQDKPGPHMPPNTWVHGVEVGTGSYDSMLGKYVGVMQHEFYRASQLMRLRGGTYQTYTIRINDEASMTVTSNHGRETVHLYFRPGSGCVLPRRGFVITPMVGGVPDYTNTRLYPFGFDADKPEDEFSYSEIPDLKAGNRMVWDDGGKYGVSYDGTGGGDIAAETGLDHEPNENINPYAALSNVVYADGVAYPMAEITGSIYGIGVAGTTLRIAEYYEQGSDKFIRTHDASLTLDDCKNVKNISYGSVLGVAKIAAKAVVNFSVDLKAAVVGKTVIVYPEDGPIATETIVTTTGEEVIWSGFRKRTTAEERTGTNTVKFTLKKTATTRTGGTFCPHNFEEYGMDWDSNPTGSVTTWQKTESYKYYDLEYVPGWDINTATPDYQGSYLNDAQCTVIKKPIIVFQGIYPITVYTWMRTVSVESISVQKVFRWYYDYKLSELVRCSWERGYVSTQNYEQYGAFEPVEGDVLNTRSMSVNNQVVLIGSANSSWFYTVSDREGDFALRKTVNGVKSDALLVSKSGKTLVVTDTYKVGIL